MAQNALEMPRQLSWRRDPDQRSFQARIEEQPCRKVPAVNHLLVDPGLQYRLKVCRVVGGTLSRQPAKTMRYSAGNDHVAKPKTLGGATRWFKHRHAQKLWRGIGRRSRQHSNAGGLQANQSMWLRLSDVVHLRIEARSGGHSPPNGRPPTTVADGMRDIGGDRHRCSGPTKIVLALRLLGVRKSFAVRHGTPEMRETCKERRRGQCQIPCRIRSLQRAKCCFPV